ncbi:hypothetical protein [Micrococcus sp. FDAARGOS_333]|uniref:hypothetical protein n=1 Tax=Micrococcus sp. FDAARGOS_333 TaxID=1930558 RepID=UPI000B4E3FB0|nr:hypothetical protein [Micrococcus sp. FDAARGOS_333]PNL17192.1 hypothetical protein CEQ11_002685 [Micrococcus sp. FDAARGOS_333]
MSTAGGAHGQPSVGHDRTNLLLPITVAFVLLPLAVVLLRAVFVGFGWISGLYLAVLGLPHALCGAAVAAALWRLPRANPEHEPTPGVVLGRRLRLLLTACWVLGVLAILVHPDYTDAPGGDGFFFATSLLADALGTSDEVLALWLSPPLLLGSAACGIAAIATCLRRSGDPSMRVT